MFSNAVEEDGANDKENKDLDQSEIKHHLRIIDGLLILLNMKLNETCKEVDKQLSNVNLSGQTISTANNLLAELFDTMDMVKTVNNWDDSLNKLKQMEKLATSKTINTVKPEIIEENDQENAENCSQMEVDLSLSNKKNCPTENLESTENLELPINSKTKKTLKDPKPENHPYSSSENEEENGEEQENNVQQQSSPLTDKNCVEKLEELEEAVEIIPELGEMSIEEIERKAAENAKRNKRIRYFSSNDDSEEESRSKKKKKNAEKSKKRDQISKSRQDKKDSSQGESAENSKSNDAENTSIQCVSNDKNQSNNQNLTDTKLRTKINEENSNGNDGNLNGNDQENQILLIKKFIEDAKKVARFQTKNDEIDETPLDIVEQTECITCIDKVISKFVRNSKPQSENTDSLHKTDTMEIFSTFGTTTNQQEQLTTIKQALDMISDKIFKQIEDDFDIMTKNAINIRIIEILIKSCKENVKLFLHVMFDRFLIWAAEISLNIMVGAKLIKELTKHDIVFRDEMITLKMSNRFRELDIKNATGLRNSLIPVFDENFKDDKMLLDLRFKCVIDFAKFSEKKFDMFVCKSSKKVDKLLEMAEFVALFEEITKNRVKFLEFVRKEVECNYKIDF